MGERTNIEWADRTFNPWIGCTAVSPGCDHCYAEAWAKRSGLVEWGNAPRRRTSPQTWRSPLKWQRDAAAFMAMHGRRQRVFAPSLADPFDNQVDPAWRADFFDLIRMTPDLDWILVTKRPQNMARMLPADWGPGWPNVWLLVSIEGQPTADQRLAYLLRIPAVVHGVSYEPALGPVEFVHRPDGRPAKRDDQWRNWLTGEAHGYLTDYVDLPGLDWIVMGGESGPGARPMHPDWARQTRDACAAAGVPFHFKQWGAWLPWSHFHPGIEDDPEVTRYDTREWRDGEWHDIGHPIWCDSVDGTVDDEHCVGRVGKKAAGRELDGVIHDGYPAV